MSAAPEVLSSKLNHNNNYNNNYAREATRIKIGDIEYGFEIDDDLDELSQERARTELRETPEIVEEALDQLRELIKGEGDLDVRTDDKSLIRFLRTCKWYPKSALELMKRHYTYYANRTKYTKDLLPENEKNVLTNNRLRHLPVRTFEDCRIIMMEGGAKWDPKQHPLDEVFRSLLLYFEAIAEEPKTQVGGVRLLIDMSDLPFSHIPHFTPSFVAASTDYIQNCAPFRMKGVHIVNQPYIFSMVFSLFRPFLSEKLYKRIHFHGGDRESLMKFIDAKALPSQYGGDLVLPYDEQPVGDAIHDMFIAHNDIFLANRSQGYVWK